MVKTKFMLPLLVLFLVVIGLFSLIPFAWGPHQIQSPITVQTDRDSYERGDTIKISGQVEDVEKYYFATIQVRQFYNYKTHYFMNIDIVPDPNGRFSATFSAGDLVFSDRYNVIAFFGTTKKPNAQTWFTYTGVAGNPIKLVPDISIPNWMRGMAGFWCEGKILDSYLVGTIKSLIDDRVIMVPPTNSESGSAEKVPGWIKNTACWWSQDQITDKDYVSGIQYLIEKGIIQV